MIFKSIIGATCACVAVVSFNTNAVVVNTLNGINYEWLELTETAGQTRNSIQAQIDVANPGGALYGYQYASRMLVESLFASYFNWGGVSGYHTASSSVTGTVDFLADFGITDQRFWSEPSTVLDTDGNPVSFTAYDRVRGLYGLSNECSGVERTCVSFTTLYYSDGLPVASYISSVAGVDASYVSPDVIFTSISHSDFGSFLVREAAVVPIPPAIWLFGSGLIGLAGIARRKART